jgi:hypothetical protein
MCCSNGCSAATVAAAPVPPAPPPLLPAATTAATAVAALLPPAVMRTDSWIWSRDCLMSGEPEPSPEGPERLMLMAGRFKHSSALLLAPNNPDALTLIPPP